MTLKKWMGKKHRKNKGKAIFNYCNGYIKFLNESKTEREIVKKKFLQNCKRAWF